MASLPVHFPLPASATLAAIERFLAAAREPALLEPGEPVLPLVKGAYAIEPRSAHVLVQAWDERRNLVRRAIGVRESARGKLTLAVELFGGREGQLHLLDMASPKSAEWRRKGAKLVFRERFREILAREWSGWTIEELSTEIDLEHSLSPVFPRALLRKGTRAMAAIAASPETGAAGVLSFGLIWLEYLRKRERRLAVEALILALPAGQARETALRLAHLDPARARFELLTYNQNDFALRLDLRDAGNLETALTPCPSPAPVSTLDELDGIPGFERVARPDGVSSLRIWGFEFGRMPGPVSGAELVAHARELSRLRGTAGSLLHAKDPERWLESQVRAGLESIDASLVPGPVYGQTPTFTAGERGVVDLLAIDRAGRLAVMELKATADLHLPLQALDYWMRVAHHAERLSFNANGYFPGITVSMEKPRMLLIAPAFEFHPTTETILGFFRPEIEVLRIGLAANWREKVRVMFRLWGSEMP